MKEQEPRPSDRISLFRRVGRAVINFFETDIDETYHEVDYQRSFQIPEVNVQVALFAAILRDDDAIIGNMLNAQYNRLPNTQEREK